MRVLFFFYSTCRNSHHHPHPPPAYRRIGFAGLTFCVERLYLFSRRRDTAMNRCSAVVSSEWMDGWSDGWMNAKGKRFWCGGAGYVCIGGELVPSNKKEILY